MGKRVGTKWRVRRIVKVKRDSAPSKKETDIRGYHSLRGDPLVFHRTRNQSTAMKNKIKFTNSKGDKYK